MENNNIKLLDSATPDSVTIGLKDGRSKEYYFEDGNAVPFFMYKDQVIFGSSNTHKEIIAHFLDKEVFSDVSTDCSNEERHNAELKAANNFVKYAHTFGRWWGDEIDGQEIYIISVWNMTGKDFLPYNRGVDKFNLFTKYSGVNDRNKKREEGGNLSSSDEEEMDIGVDSNTINFGNIMTVASFFKLNPEDTYVAIGRKLIPLGQQQEDIKISDDEQKEMDDKRAIHLMNQQDKRKATEAFRQNRQEVQNDKLRRTKPDGSPDYDREGVPEVEYRYYKYVDESKNSKRVFITEEQMKHLLEISILNENNEQNEYFENEDYLDSNADNFEGEDGEYYHYLDGTPFAEVDGKFYVGGDTEMHSDCAAKAAYEDFEKDANAEIEELESQKEDLEERIKEYEELGVDLSYEEEDLEEVKNRIEELNDILENYDYQNYWYNYLDYDGRENWVQSLENCGRFWLDGNGSGVIACWSTPSVSYLNDIVTSLNQWAKENGENIDFSNFKIAVGGTGVGWGGHKKAMLIPIKNYQQEITFRNQVYRNENPDGRQEPSQVRQQIAQDRAAHLLNYQQKQTEKENPNGAYYGYLRDRGEQEGKKLGKMTMAQWNDMKYGQPVAENIKEKDLIRLIKETIHNSLYNI